MQQKVDYSLYVETIAELLSSASTIAQSYFGNLNTEASVKENDNNQVLTEADTAIGEHLVEKLTQKFPDHNVIDEEAGVIDNASEFTWVVDPIDGTSNFATGLPTYGVMIGLLHNDTPIAGGISLPAFQEVYVGGINHPATKNGQPISVSSETSLLNSLVAYGIDGHQEDPQKTYAETAILAKIILASRNLRTTNSAYDLAHVADGMYGVCLNQTTKIWDNVALHALVEAAGGICTDFYGNPLDYSNPLTKKEQNYTICAGSPSLHTQIQAIIHNHDTHIHQEQIK